MDSHKDTLAVSGVDATGRHQQTQVFLNTPRVIVGCWPGCRPSPGSSGSASKAPAAMAGPWPSTSKLWHKEALMRRHKSGTGHPRSLMWLSVLVGGVLVVVGDQGPLDRGADLPVEPDGGIQGEQALHHPRPQPGGDPAAVPVQAKLVLEGPDDRLDPLAQPVREAPRVGFVGPGRAGDAKVQIGQGGLEVVTGKALVAPSSVPDAGRLAGTPSMSTTAWRSPTSLGLASPNPVTVPSGGQTSSSRAPQEKQWWAVSRP